MYVYIVHNKRYDFFEVYYTAPEWSEEYQMWLGKGFMMALCAKALKVEHASALRRDGKPHKFYVGLNVLFEEEEGVCS